MDEILCWFLIAWIIGMLVLVVCLYVEENVRRENHDNHHTSKRAGMGA